MIIKTLPVGPIMANCFIIGCDTTRKGAIVDPGDEAGHILSTVNQLGLTISYIINTHGHFDHVSANADVKAATNAPILIHKADAPMLGHLSETAATFGLRVKNSPAPDQFLEDGQKIQIGEIVLEVLHTPGHTLGGVSLFDGNAHLFVGDTLFAGSVGRTDFPGGDFGTLKRSIREKLFTLDDDVKVHAGHGPDTTVGIERRTNPFVGMR